MVAAVKVRLPRGLVTAVANPSPAAIENRDYIVTLVIG